MFPTALSILTYLAIVLNIILPVATGQNLGIEWNPTAKANNWYNFGARVIYDPNGDTDDQVNGLTDEKLVGLTRRAYEDMTALPSFQAITRTKSSVMAALVVGNEVYFASSITGAFSGAQSFLYDWVGDPNTDDGIPETTRLLQSCQVELMQTADEGKGYSNRHRYEARCAEPMAVHHYLVGHPGDNFWGKNARIAAWGIQSGQGLADFLKACSTPKN